MTSGKEVRQNDVIVSACIDEKFASDGHVSFSEKSYDHSLPSEFKETEMVSDYTLPDGSSFTGPIREDRPEGCGTIVWQSGSRYSGDFVKGVP
jgi:hypothetical protein